MARHRNIACCIGVSQAVGIIVYRETLDATKWGVLKVLNPLVTSVSVTSWSGGFS